MDEQDYDTIYDAVFEVVSEYHKRRSQAIETACEAALQGGTCGVLVVDRPHGSTVKVDPFVPYGKIDFQVRP